MQEEKYKTSLRRNNIYFIEKRGTDLLAILLQWTGLHALYISTCLS